MKIDDLIDKIMCGDYHIHKQGRELLRLDLLVVYDELELVEEKLEDALVKIDDLEDDIEKLNSNVEHLRHELNKGKN